jgi:hypothetical protein
MKNRILALILVCILVAVCLTVFPKRGAEPASPAATETAAATQAPTVPTTTEAAAPEPLGLAEVPGLEIGEDEGFFGLCCADGAGYVLLQRWDQAAETERCRLVVLDPATPAVVSEAELEAFPNDAGFSRLSVAGNEVLLIDEYGERCAVYDRAGAFLGLRDYPVMSRENRGWQNRLLNDDCFWKGADFASYTDGGDTELSRLVAFYDETDRVHALKEPYDELAAAAGHRLLTRRLGEDDELIYVLSDLDAELRMGEIVLPASDVAGAQWVNSCGAAIGEDWVLLAAEWSGERISNARRVFFWYPDPEEQTPLEEEIFTEEIFTERIAALKTELEALGMTIHLDEAPAPEQTTTTGLNVSESVCDTGASLFGQYRILERLKGFTDKLPEGFIRELWSQMPGDCPDRDSLHIFIVRNIPGDAAGFASVWMEPMLICFATEEFGDAHLAHEFMHVIDFRLNQYNATVHRDLENEWARLSPWWAYDTWLTEKQEEELAGCFVSGYARTNSAEDRAETFQALFDSTEPVAEAWWYEDNPGVQAKAAYLVRAIRAAFPSVQAVEKAWWEKLPEAS